MPREYPPDRNSLSAVVGREQDASVAVDSTNWRSPAVARTLLDLSVAPDIESGEEIVMPKFNAIQAVILCRIACCRLWRRIRCAARTPAQPHRSPWSSSATRLPRARVSTTATPYYTGFPDEWYGGVVNPEWQGDYQLCHDSAQAYGDVLAPMIGATLTKFACTGSTYDNGIAFDRRYDGALYRPAQFGNWLGMTNLNPAYDAAKPDVVIITLGADDVSFADVFTFCATGYTDAAEVAAIAKRRTDRASFAPTS